MHSNLAPTHAPNFPTQLPPKRQRPQGNEHAGLENRKVVEVAQEQGPGGGKLVCQNHWDYKLHSLQWKWNLSNCLLSGLQLGSIICRPNSKPIFYLIHTCFGLMHRCGICGYLNRVLAIRMCMQDAKCNHSESQFHIMHGIYPTQHHKTIYWHGRACQPNFIIRVQVG